MTEWVIIKFGHRLWILWGIIIQPTFCITKSPHALSHEECQIDVDKSVVSNNIFPFVHIIITKYSRGARLKWHWCD